MYWNKSTPRLLIFVLVALVATPGLAAVAKTPTPAATVSALNPGKDVYFGVDLDWANDNLANYSERLGKTPFLSYVFLPYPLDANAIATFTKVLDESAQTGGGVVAALQPSQSLDKLTAVDAQAFATIAATAEASGEPVLVDFAAQMNGSWFPYGLEPTKFVPAYRLFVNTVRAAAPRTLFVWSPAYAGGYPFVTREYLPDPKSKDFALLDTNRDGSITIQDDPYAPFYPGDDYVDWVGMTLNHWGSAYPWHENEVPEAGKLLDELHGEYNGLNGDSSALPDFYAQYVQKKNKPFILRTAALYLPGKKGATQSGIKRSWWRQVFSDKTFKALPGLKAVIWEEWDRPEFETDGAMVDWRVTASTRIREEFIADLPVDRLIFAPKGLSLATPAP